MVLNNHRAISKVEMVKLSFWTEYGITPASFISQLIRENILYEYVNQNTEYYYFAYDQMNDYYCAKAIFEACGNEREIREYLARRVLKIEEGKNYDYGNIDLFVNACALYAEKYGAECIDIIDELRDENDRWDIFSRYIESFQWRENRCIDKDVFLNLIRQYPCAPEDIWPTLIGNSIKVNHPLNADFLHELLMGYELNTRDYIWTIYINGLPLKDEDRIIQLIQMYDRGEKLDITSEKQVELLLKLFGWLLTSSNRWLRDYASKAMIEILKQYFHLCQSILDKFKNVNDPYVIQRLYGVVFGACCKREGGNLQTLAEYVYSTVFDQEKVYPDILLRDYARLIIERFLSEKKDYKGIIESEKITPPYKSEPIPEIEYQYYEDKEYDGSLYWLIHSMRIENMGGYGDFGRYVFQSALHSFDIDDKRMFNYAVYYILNDLGYNDDYFNDHDQHCGSVTAEI